MIKYRKWAKYLNTYLEPWRYEHMDDRGRIHSNYKLFGTVTGRLSGEGGIQQVPRDPFIRSIIGAEPGWLFVAADYSQVELRIAAMLAGEKRMLRQYLRGEDIHMIRACRMTGKLSVDVTKEERKKAKAVNFGYIYGMSWQKFMLYAFENYELEITAEEAERDRELFFEDYPGLRPWHERQRRLANRYQRVVSPIGRVRHLTSILSQDKDVRSEAERQAINSPVQSLASDLMLFALIRLHKMMPAREARIVGTVHDSILFEVRVEHVHKWAPIIRMVMEDMDRVRQTFGAEITVPIVADIEIGTHWAEGSPYDKEKDYAPLARQDEAQGRWARNARRVPRPQQRRRSHAAHGGQQELFGAGVGAD
jgi:DNA polymerase-1